MGGAEAGGDDNNQGSSETLLCVPEVKPDLGEISMGNRAIKEGKLEDRGTGLLTCRDLSWACYGKLWLPAALRKAHLRHLTVRAKPCYCVFHGKPVFPDVQFLLAL